MVNGELPSITVSEFGPKLPVSSVTVNPPNEPLQRIINSSVG